MDITQIDSYKRSNQLYKEILLKFREKTLETPPEYLLPTHQTELSNTNKIAVIIDPRYDDLMEAVIMNFMHFMVSDGWLFMIATAEEYKQKAQERFPQSLFLSLDKSLLYYDENNIPNLTIDYYNALLCSSDLWNKIPCEHVAIFQKDCIMYRMFTEEWVTKYAYSGAFWYNTETCFKNGVINGGFSLRKKSAMLNCIKYVSWDMIELYRSNEYTCNEYFPVKVRNEDMFFTYACDILRYPISPIHLRKQLAIESEYFIGTSVFHGWNKIGYQNEYWAKQILTSSPLFSKYINDVLLVKKTDDTIKNEKNESDSETKPEIVVKPVSTTTTTKTFPVFELPEKSNPEIIFY